MCPQRSVALGRPHIKLDQALYLQMLGKKMCNQLLNLKVISVLEAEAFKTVFLL